MPLVSIIIPVYNAEDYIERCVTSLLSQTHHEIEVVVVDDGSRDRSGEICDRLALGDRRLIVHHKENGGVTAARQLALSLCKGEYVSFVDADDYVEPTYIEHLLRPVVEDGVEVSCCQYFKTVNGVDHVERRRERGMMDRQRIEQVLRTDFLFDYQSKMSGVPLYLWGKLMSRKWAETVIEYGKGMWYGEDAAGMLYMMYHLHTLFVSETPLYHYVSHPGQAIKKPGRKRWDANVRLWRKFVETDTRQLLVSQLPYRMDFFTRKYLNVQAIKAHSWHEFRQEMLYALDNDFVREHFIRVKMPHLTPMERFYKFMMRHKLTYAYYLVSKWRFRDKKTD